MSIAAWEAQQTKRKKAREEADQKLRDAAAVGNGDVEVAHALADEALLILVRGYDLGDFADEWEKIPKWYA